jgi:hypothetical protein
MGAGRQQSAARSGADVHRWPSIIASSCIFCARFSALSLTFVRMFRCIDTLLFLSISIFASTKWHGTKSTRSTLPCTFTFSLLRHSTLADHATTRSRSGPSSRLRSCHEHEHSTTRLRSCHEHEHSTTRLRSCHEHEHSTTRFSPDHIKHQTRLQSQALGTPRHTPEECQSPVFPSQPFSPSESSAGMQKGISSTAASTYWIG